ncbi:peptidylprolyl isomerase [Capnocytophaga canimorsus]|uniref:peptidylprolyl isomerase n=1 Tax=Capnocytophaga canimorsus TaxID=28188 RepID=UPI000F4F1CD8|nr:peptidylprolyl isomerase [Capnocytophaga canimorsus]AYW37039.1 peptidylprolyl isomerase [Capnocytophaga canimorsus]
MKYRFLTLLLGLSFLLLGSCKDKKQDINTQQKEIISEKNTTTKQEEIPEVLTTQSAIPFLFEYEKKNKERKVRITTSYGDIDIELFEQTPYHRANFIFLTKQKYFDGTVFHRVVPDFVVQGGNSDGWDVQRKRRKIGNYLLPPDTKKGFKHHRGIVSMPSSEIDNPHQFASPYEFFIVAQAPGAYHLDGKYTAFGRVTAGMEVVDKINKVKTDERNWPITDVKMIQVKILE